MRDYANFDKYFTRLTQDVYSQPPDPGHTAWALHALRTICTIPQGIKNVLDIGCGQGFLKHEFENLGLEWTGVTIGEDYLICKEAGLNVHNADMSFLPFEDRSFDLVFARHVLEHSPCPVITLMEWERVCRGWMVLIAPAPEYWGVRGRNHYATLYAEQLDWLLNRSGWKIIHEVEFDNKHPLYIAHWKLYQDKCPRGTEDVDARNLREGTPKQIVEYRMLCERIKPILE